MKRTGAESASVRTFDGVGFDRVVAALDAVRLRCPDLPVLSILWMHAKHPVHPVQTALITGSDTDGFEGPSDVARSLFHAALGRIGRSRSPAVRLVVALLNACRLATLLLSFRWRCRAELRALRSRRFVLIAKSWGYGSRPRDPAWEFFYGDLQKRLADRGLPMLVLYGDSIEGDSPVFIKNHMATGELACLPELCLIPFWAPFAMIGHQVRSALRLRKLSRELTDAIESRVAEWAARDCLLPAITRTGLYFWLGRETVRMWRPRAWMTLYEGQPWEKVVWCGAKVADDQCRVIGYQQAAVFPEATSMLAPVVEVPGRSVPDLILALGERSAELLRPGHNPIGSAVIPFGTFRYQRIDRDGPVDAGLRTVLVLPEGLAAEIACLFDFAFRAAALLEDYRFILRCHPNWPIERALDLLSLDPSDYPNVLVSQEVRIEADYTRASAMLYRGTSAALYGVLYGLLPVYLKTSELPDSDPLYAMPAWHRTSVGLVDFQKLLEADRNRDVEERKAEWGSGAAYIREYAEAVSDDRIDTLVRMGLGK